MRVLVLYDQITESSRPDERDVLFQAEAVSFALRELGHEVSELGFGPDITDSISKVTSTRPDLVFNLVESVRGNGSLIYLVPGILDALSIPYTGAPTEALMTTSGKILTKRILKGCGLATPPWFTGTGCLNSVEFVGTRYLVKAVWEHASIGMDDSSIVRPSSYKDLLREIEKRERANNGEFFAEAYIEGREFNLSVLDGETGPQVLPPAEIKFIDYPEGKPKLVGYPAKWEPDSFEFRNTPRTFDFPPEDSSIPARLATLSKDCWHLFKLRGYARVDFRVDDEGCPWILEINANPCLSPDAGFAAALAEAKITFKDAVERIIKASRRGNN